MTQEEKNEEKVEETEENIVEQDGEIMVRQDVEESEEEPETDPKGQSEEDNSETEEANEQDEDSQSTESEESVKDEPTKFKGKSREDLLKMVEDGTHTISKLSDENKNYREKLKDVDVDPQEIKKKLTAEDFKQSLSKERDKLNYLDRDLNKDEFDKQQAVVNQLESDWLEKRQDEKIDKRLNDNENAVFIEKQKAKLEKDGVKVDDFDEITEIAKQYSNNGKLDEGSYQKALIDKYGLNTVMSFYNTKVEDKVRKDIKKAGKNQDKRINVNESGKGVRRKLVNLDKLSPRERDQVLDSLSTSDLQKLVEMREKKGIM